MVIARKYLLPRQIGENGIKVGQIKLDDATMEILIKRYTHEAGVRNLERGHRQGLPENCPQGGRGRQGPVRDLGKDGGKVPGTAQVSARIPARHQRPPGAGQRRGPRSVANCCSTSVPGKGKLLLTGQLGEVMKESAQAALSYCRSRNKALGVEPEYFDTVDIHIHVPAGAIPQDGPRPASAMTTALFSAISGKAVKPRTAMTGEVTLRGRVLPIGSLKDKALAASGRHRQGDHPGENQKDLVEIPEELRRKIHFFPVGHMDEVIELALGKIPRRRKPGSHGPAGTMNRRCGRLSRSASGQTGDA